MMGTNNFSSTIMGGNFQIKNNSGVTINTIVQEAILTVNSNNVSFENDSYPNKNIVLGIGLRTSITDNQVVFHKPGDTITANSSQNQLKLLFKADLTNLKTKLSTLENSGSGSNYLVTFRQSIIDHTSINSPYNTLKDTITIVQKYPTIIKTLLGDNVLPKTTHTLLTVYYTSYIFS
jgi:hypothetical protein